MSVIAEISIIPLKEHMANDIAAAVKALAGQSIHYEIHPMGTIVESDSIDQVLEAFKAALSAVSGKRFIATLKVDMRKDVKKHARENVAAIENILWE
jgi:uncharacterized protein (TIGR00106 family)